MIDQIIPLEEYERRRRNTPRFRRINTNDLMAKQFDPIRWIVPDYLPEGFSVLAGRQKLGKTWLALDVALAVATGGMAVGAIRVDVGDVLYLDLENGERRVQRRIETLYPDPRTRPDLSRLEFATETIPLDKGLIEALDDWRLSVPNPRLVVIDVLQRIKPPGRSTRNAYEQDYTAWSPLQRWAMEHGIAVLGLHHTRKGGADDPLESLSGSNGLSACADTTLVLDRNGNGTTLYVRGRDVDEKESALDFSGGLWTLKGDASKLRVSGERQAVLDALLDAGEPMSPSDLAAILGLPNGTIRKRLFDMAKAGDIVREDRGRYRHPDTPSSISNVGNVPAKAHENQGLTVSGGGNIGGNVTDNAKGGNIDKSLNYNDFSINVTKVTGDPGDIIEILDEDGIDEFLRSPP